jgi:hypothetical protein
MGVQYMEVDNDSDGEDVEESEEVADPDHQSLLKQLCLANDDDGSHDDIIHDDTRDSDDEAPADPGDKLDYDPNDPNYF